MDASKNKRFLSFHKIAVSMIALRLYIYLVISLIIAVSLGTFAFLQTARIFSGSRSRRQQESIQKKARMKMEQHLSNISRKAIPSDLLSSDPPHEKLECTICLGYFEKESPEDEWKETIVELCTGKHKYHLKCINEWTVYKDECPLCKEKIVPK